MKEYFHTKNIVKGLKAIQFIKQKVSEGLTFQQAVEAYKTQNG